MKHPDHFISCMSYERLHKEEHFHIKKWLWDALVTFYRQKLYEKVIH